MGHLIMAMLAILVILLVMAAAVRRQERLWREHMDALMMGEAEHVQSR